MKSERFMNDLSEFNKAGELNFEKVCRSACVSAKSIELLGAFLSGNEYRYPIAEIYMKTLVSSIEKDILNKSFYDTKLRYIPGYHPLHMRGIDTFANLSTLQENDNIVNTYNHEIILDAQIKSSSVVTVVSCDSIYFERFSEDFFNSFLSISSENDILNIHIVNPKQNHIDNIKKLDASNIRVTASYIENPPIALYTTARYFMGYEILKEYKCIVNIQEFDVTFVGSPATMILKYPSKEEVVVCLNTPSPSLPWQTYMASFCVVYPNNLGNNFLNHYCKIAHDIYKNYMQKNVIELWYYDQIILFYLFRTELFPRENNWSLRDKIFTMVKK
jgi:hypothetical protein